MGNHKNGNIIARLIIASIFLVFYIFCVVRLPAINGTVLYEGSNTPVEGAYIICLYYKYHLSEAINVGGPNFSFNDVEIVRTDKDGKFLLGSYTTISLTYFDNIREFLIYKPGYSVLRYYHSSPSTFIDMNAHPMQNKIKIKDKFIITDKINNENNNILGVCSSLRYFANYFKYNDPQLYNKHLNSFKDIYFQVLNDSNRYTECKHIYEWLIKGLKELKYDLNLNQ